MITGGEVVELRGEGKLESVAVELASDETRELPADLLVVSVGQILDLGGLESWKIGVRGTRIEVDSSMQTARSAVHAVGDFAI